MTPLVKKWIIRPILITVVSILAIAGVGILLLLAEQERIVNLAIAEVNKQFKGELTVNSSKISLFKHFPSVGVALHQATFYPDKTRTSEAIFHFEKLYVGVNVPDLIDGKYNLRRVSLHDGRLDLVKANDGTINLLEALNVHGDTTSSSSDVSFDINLDKISFKGLGISYLEESTGRVMEADITELTSAFKSDSSLMTVTMVSEMELDLKTPSDTSMFRHKKFGVDITADYKIKQSLLEITSGSFKLEEAAFNVEGSVSFAGNTNLDIRVMGDKPDINLLAAFLPGDVKAAIAPFKYDGEVHFEGLLFGDLTADQLPFIEINFSCQDAWFHNPEANERLDEVRFRGYYTNGQEQSLRTSELHMLNMSARPGKGIFKGNFVVRDFTDPQILMQVGSELELKFLGNFFGIKDLQQFTGKIKLDMNFKEIMDINLPEQSLSKLEQGIQSKLAVEHLTFRIPGYPHQIKDLNLHAQMKDKRVTLDSARFRIGGSDMRISGSVSDIDGFLHDPARTVVLTLQANGNNVLLKELLSYDTALANKIDEEIHNLNVALKLETSVAHLLNPSPLPLGKFEMSNLRASFKKYPHKFKNLDASVQITDSILLVNNLSGAIDSSDLKFNGRIRNYKLWFKEKMVGRTQIAFDFKSDRFALDDILMRGMRRWIPRGYRHEQLNNAWLQATVDLKYDTVFRFAKAQITNVTGVLKKHNITAKGITGKVR